MDMNENLRYTSKVQSLRMCITCESKIEIQRLIKHFYSVVVI